MFNKIARFYCVLFRFGGLAMAILSLAVSIIMAIDITLHGYILVDGSPPHSLRSILTAICTPLIGVAIGLALYFLIPKVQVSSGRKN